MEEGSDKLYSHFFFCLGGGGGGGCCEVLAMMSGMQFWHTSLLTARGLSGVLRLYRAWCIL